MNIDQRTADLIEEYRLLPTTPDSFAERQQIVEELDERGLYQAKEGERVGWCSLETDEWVV